MNSMHPSRKEYLQILQVTENKPFENVLWILPYRTSFRANPRHMYIPMANYIYHFDIQGIAYIQCNVHLSNLFIIKSIN